MISVQSWSTGVALGSPGVVTFTVAAARPVVALDVDLLGDGLVAPTQLRGEDLRAVVGLRFTPARSGVYGLQVLATDAAGCVGATGLRRDVVVQ